MSTEEPVASTPNASGPSSASQLPVPPAWVAQADRCARGASSLRWRDGSRRVREFPTWQNDVRQYVRCVLRTPDADDVIPGVSIDAAVDVGAHLTRLHVWYSVWAPTDGRVLRVPAFLFVPETSVPVPAVIVYHGHGPGKIAAAEPIPNQPENAAALEIARTLGYVVLAPDSRTFGEFGFAEHDAYFTSIAAADETDSYIARIVGDGRADMALLRARNDVDPERVGVAGVSMGSWRAMLHAVTTPGLRAVVVSALFLPFGELFSAHHHACQHVPALGAMLGMDDLALAISDGSLLVQWGGVDGAFAPAAHELLEQTQALFRDVGRDDRLVVDVEPERSHEFGVASMIDFLEARLGPGAWPRVP